jgi:bacteriorhodopsin
MAATIFARGNDALNINPAAGSNTLTTHGSDWLWAVFSIMTISTLISLGFSFRKPRSERIFFHITTAYLMVASVAYFTMASDLGYTTVNVEFSGHQAAGTRQVFYARYIYWFITTPLILLDLLFLSGIEWNQIGFALFADCFAVIMGLIGALVPSTYKWGYFTMAIVAFFYVGYVVLFAARRAALKLGDDIHKIFFFLAAWELGLAVLYPIAWGLSEGGNVITVDSEAVFYGVLDLLTQPVFAVVLLWRLHNIDLQRLGLHDERVRTGFKADTDKSGGVPVSTATVNRTSDATAA